MEYAFAIQKLRESYYKVPHPGHTEPPHSHHHCGIAAFNEMGGLGYPDLDDLLKSPHPLVYTFGTRSPFLFGFVI